MNNIYNTSSVFSLQESQKSNIIYSRRKIEEESFILSDRGQITVFTLFCYTQGTYVNIQQTHAQSIRERHPTEAAILYRRSEYFGGFGTFILASQKCSENVTAPFLMAAHFQSNCLLISFLSGTLSYRAKLLTSAISCTHIAPPIPATNTCWQASKSNINNV